MSCSKFLREILAANMKTLRARDNISQEDFADLCGLHRTYISDIERCNRNISIDNIERIANAFYVTASELFKIKMDCPGETLLVIELATSSKACLTRLLVCISCCATGETYCLENNI